MRELSQIDQITLADLVQKTLDAEVDPDFAPGGSMHLLRRGDRKFWYYKGYEKPLTVGGGRQFLKYVGPESDQAIQRRVEEFRRIKTGYGVRRELASKLRAAKLPRPTRLEGEVLSALARAGIFEMGAVLVGSLAYQTYSGLLGVRLPAAPAPADDLDGAQSYAIAGMPSDATETLLGGLQSVDPTFHPIPPVPADGFVSATGYKVRNLHANQRGVGARLPRREPREDRRPARRRLAGYCARA